MPNIINLIDQNFNGWKVISKLPSKNGKTYWLCECEECHSQKEIQGTHLRNLTCGKCHCQTQKNKLSKSKICPLCGKEFFPLERGQSRKFCFDCSPSYTREMGKSQNITAIRRALKKHLVEYKGGKCEICGYNNCISALQFHHLHPEEKDFTIADNLHLNNFDIKKYYQEVDKCILVCANCHAEIHEKEYSDGQLMRSVALD